MRRLLVGEPQCRDEKVLRGRAEVAVRLLEDQFDHAIPIVAVVIPAVDDDVPGVGRLILDPEQEVVGLGTQRRMRTRPILRLEFFVRRSRFFSGLFLLLRHGLHGVNGMPTLPHPLCRRGVQRSQEVIDVSLALGLGRQEVDGKRCIQADDRGRRQQLYGVAVRPDGRVAHPDARSARFQLDIREEVVPRQPLEWPGSQGLET
ncbi:hypothetical protein [Bradyrhizobium sp. USDA 4541]|uniref:hypothetical protein n=1 Tax=Bradyrhizobium sp. USDA 4541 TaxID=2817704 RepID=UPI0035C6E192